MSFDPLGVIELFSYTLLRVIEPSIFALVLAATIAATYLWRVIAGGYIIV